MKPFLKYWLPVLVWLGVIFIGSTDLMSGEHTSRIIGPLLRWLKPEISPETIVAVQLFVRKLAHLTEYAILAALLVRALRAEGGLAISRALIGALLGAASYAVLDEFHQSFVASRSGSPTDVMIDICGAAIGLAAYGLLWKRKSPTETRN